MNRRPQLDGLRAIAVLAVIATHCGAVPAWLDGWMIGNLGVSLFFVLSGFLITGILVRARKATVVDAGEWLIIGPPETWTILKRFYARRALRILPLYIVAVGTLYAIGHADVNVYKWEYATATVNMIPWFDPMGFWLCDIGARHFWSLSVEEQFYLVWPILVLFTPRRRLPLLMICTVLTGLAFRLSAIADTLYWQDWQYLAPIHCDELGLGACAAFFGPPGRHIAIGAGIAFWAVHGTAAETFVGPINWALVCAWIVGRADRAWSYGLGDSWRILEARPLVYLGTISYGVYVWHWPIEWALPHLGVHVAPGAGLFALVLGLTMLVASISWFALERPLNGLKRFFPIGEQL